MAYHQYPDSHRLYPVAMSSDSSSSSSSHPPTSPSSAHYWNTVLNPPPAKFDCVGCHAIYSSQAALQNHQRTCVYYTTGHHKAHPIGLIPDKPYQCAQCGVAFKKNSNLVKHMKLVHLGERNFECPYNNCGRMFGQKSNLNSHVRAVHLHQRPFKCDKPGCTRAFSQKSGLKAHIKTVHDGERPYKCDACSAAFGHRGDLNRHIRVLHNKERPYECHICPGHKTFGRKSVLARHMQTHRSQQS